MNYREVLKTLAFFTLLFLYTITAHATMPCWYWSPVASGKVGFVGAASAFSVKKDGSKLASRKRALNDFASYYGVKIENLTDEKILQDSLLLGQHHIRFSAPYLSDSGMFSYALVSPTAEIAMSTDATTWLSSQCEPQTCNFKMCTPAWLCTGNSSQIFGVSHLTSTPSMQLANMKSNAQTLASFLQQSDVLETVKQIKSTGQYQNWGLKSRVSSVAASSAADVLLNTSMCATKNYVFGVFSTSTNTAKVSNKGFEAWSREPGLRQKAGVVGSFDGMTADGLLSTSVTLAIKDGLIQLAKIKEVNIDHEYQLKFADSWYTLSKSTEATSAAVSGVLLDLKVVENNGKLVIYAWLIEN
jgi:hypothetical protein